MIVEPPHGWEKRLRLEMVRLTGGEAQTAGNGNTAGGSAAGAAAARNRPAPASADENRVRACPPQRFFALSLAHPTVRQGVLLRRNVQHLRTTHTSCLCVQTGVRPVRSHHHPAVAQRPGRRKNAL